MYWQNREMHNAFESVGPNIFEDKRGICLCAWWTLVEHFTVQQCFAATMRKQMIPLYPL